MAGNCTMALIILFFLLINREVRKQSLLFEVHKSKLASRTQYELLKSNLQFK